MAHSEPYTHHRPISAQHPPSVVGPAQRSPSLASAKPCKPMCRAGTSGCPGLVWTLLSLLEPSSCEDPKFSSPRFVPTPSSPPPTVHSSLSLLPLLPSSFSPPVPLHPSSLPLLLSSSFFSPPLSSPCLPLCLSFSSSASPSSFPLCRSRAHTSGNLRD